MGFRPFIMGGVNVFTAARQDQYGEDTLGILQAICRADALELEALQRYNRRQSYEAQIVEDQACSAWENIAQSILLCPRELS